MNIGSLQEYEAKLEELESALLKQLQTDTAVEKLEEQRKVCDDINTGSATRSDHIPGCIFQEFMMKLEELEATLAKKHLEVIIVILIILN